METDEHGAYTENAESTENTKDTPVTGTGADGANGANGSNRKKELFRAIKFLLFSASAGIIQALSILLLESLTTLPSWLCYLVGLVLSVLWNFTLNRKFTFKSAANIPIAMLKVAAYYAVFTPLSTLGVRFLTENCGWPPFFADALAMVTNLVTEFLYQRFVVFGRSIDTAVKDRQA